MYVADDSAVGGRLGRARLSSNTSRREPAANDRATVLASTAATLFVRIPNSRALSARLLGGIRNRSDSRQSRREKPDPYVDQLAKLTHTPEST